MAKRKGDARERNESAQPGPGKCQRDQPRLEARARGKGGWREGSDPGQKGGRSELQNELWDQL